jgi:glycosyltransferase involved in cell wall biosynthesis
MKSDQPKISVIICCYTMDRWPDICAAIASVRQQTLRAVEIILVVDHNPELLSRATVELPDVMVVANREGRGLSGGRNTGIAAASGSLLAFLDDDAVADPHWLSLLAKRCEEPDVLGATSSIYPLWVGARPGWFPEEFLWIVGCTYRGLPSVVAEVRNVLGGAMMLKREVFNQAGTFNHILGRSYGPGATLVSCDDTEMCIRAKATFPTGRFVFDPAPMIGHKVPASRLNWRYLRVRCFAEGRSKAYLKNLTRARGALTTERDYVLRTLTIGFLHGLSDGVTRLQPDGVKRSAAIVLGLTSAAIGFLIGKLDDRLPNRGPSARGAL